MSQIKSCKPPAAMPAAAKRALVAAVMLACALNAGAQDAQSQTRELTGHFTDANGVSSVDVPFQDWPGGKLGFTLFVDRVDIRYRLDVLLGEPIYSVSMRWWSRTIAESSAPFFQTQHRSLQSALAWKYIERYPDLLEALSNIRPLAAELTVTIGNERSVGSGFLVDLVVDLPERRGEWSTVFTGSSPNWDTWCPDCPVGWGEHLKDLFRRSRELGPVVVKGIVLHRLRWPDGTLGSIYREYLRREEERERAETADSDDFWGSGATASTGAPPPLSASPDAGDPAAAEALRRMRTRAASLADRSSVAEVYATQAGGLMVRAVPGFPEVKVSVAEGESTRTYSVRPGETFTMDTLEPGATATVLNNGFPIYAVTAPLTTGKVVGNVWDAVTGRALAGVAVSVSGGLGESAVTDSTGRFTLSVPAGERRLRLALEGYVVPDYPVTVGAGKTTTIPERAILASPRLKGASVRFVLGWGAAPRDLDLHLRTPEGTDVNYQSRSPAGADAVLDVDNMRGYGPETITVVTAHTGDYLLYVRRFSSDASLAGSGARIQVYDSSGLTHTLTVPSIGSGPVWEVLTYNGQTGRIEVVNRVVTGVGGHQ